MLPRSPLSLIVADDHPSIRYGLVSALEDLSFISIIHSASNGQEVLNLLNTRHYDIVLMDIQMPVMNGFETTEKIDQLYPNVKVIAISMFNEERYVIEMFSKGATGYLLKNADREIIIEAIISVSNGEKYISKEITTVNSQNIHAAIQKDIHADKLDSIIFKEIIFLMSHDLKSKEIAPILRLSSRTVESYRSQILGSLGVKGMGGIVSYAIEKGIRDDIILLKKFNKYITKKIE